MPIVMKFGGTSVADAERIMNAARIAAFEAAKGKKVVVVVSAQGGATDGLIEKAREICQSPSPRELDALLATGELASGALMALALGALGRRAVSLSGRQAGIETHGEHGDARILHIDTRRIDSELTDGKIVVVAGFQGENAHGDVTTIGRGGSDTSAVALAAALNAEECLIYTDVSGVFSADPRTVDGAVRHMQVSYDEMNALASMGAKVLHGRSVSLAKSREVPVTVLSSLERGGGTRLVLEHVGQNAVTAVTCEKNAVFARVLGVTRRQAHDLLHELALRHVGADMVCAAGGAFSFSAPMHRLSAVRGAIDARAEAEARRGADWSVSILENAAKISAVGAAISENPLVAAQMLDCLERAGVEPLSLVTGDMRASVMIAGDSRVRAVQLVHDLFFGHGAREAQQVATG